MRVDPNLGTPHAAPLVPQCLGGDGDGGDGGHAGDLGRVLLRGREDVPELGQVPDANETRKHKLEEERGVTVKPENTKKSKCNCTVCGGEGRSRSSSG